MRSMQAHVPSRKRILLARRFTPRLALLALIAASSCKDTNRTVGVEREAPLNFEPSTSAAGAPATYTDGLAPSRAADPGSIVRIYKNHDAWRSISDGGRDEMTLVKLGMVKNADFFVHPMSSLASGIPTSTRVVIITANSTGDAATSEAQRGAEAQKALDSFLRTGGTLLLDLADNEADEGYRAPGATGTPSYQMPPKTVCTNATLATAGLGADGLAGTADDHRFVRGVDGLAGTADDLDDETIDLANGGMTGVDRSAEPTDLLRGCSVVHGNLEEGITLPTKARVLATATWSDGQRPVLAEYCHAGGRVVVNTFSLGYFGHKPREGASEPIRSTYIQRSLYAYALSPESYCYPPPAITAPPEVTAATDPGACTATNVGLGSPHIVNYADPVTVARSRSDDRPLDAPYPTGVTTITWTVTDAQGETATATQAVSVKDLEKPALSAPAGRTQNTDPGLPSTRVDVGAASATDNCSGGAVSITAKRSDGALTLDAPYFAGTTTVTWSARDEAGNVTTVEQTIIVLDVEAPALSVPEDFTVNATTPSGVPVQYAASARDNVAVTSFSCVPKSGDLFQIGAYNVACVAGDRAGNSTSLSFAVTVHGAPEQIAKLIAYVRGVLPSSEYQTQLLDMLRKAQADVHTVPDACADLDLFIANVSANSGTLVPADKANRMIADATRIKNVLGCPGGP
jgi:hypothetical protein